MSVNSAYLPLGSTTTCPVSGFNLSVGCFGTTLSKIAPNGQIWEFKGSRMDHSSPNYVARLFYFEKIKTNDNMVQKNRNMLIFVEQKSLRSYMPHTKVEKNKCSNKIHLKLINSIIYNQISLVISDIEMPEMDGYTLTAEVRRNPDLKNLYVVLHSSLSGVFNQACLLYTSPSPRDS